MHAPHEHSLTPMTQVPDVCHRYSIPHEKKNKSEENTSDSRHFRSYELCRLLLRVDWPTLRISHGICRHFSPASRVNILLKYSSSTEIAAPCLRTASELPKLSPERLFSPLHSTRLDFTPINHQYEVNSRADPKLPLLPQSPKGTRTGSQRCVQAEKSRYYTFENELH